MDPKTEAQHRRAIADLFDQLAEKFQPLNAAAAGSYRLNAEANRRRADELDPPQPEWQDGDLVRDCNGNLWCRSRDEWLRFGAKSFYSTGALDKNYGPLTRVLTYDPATQRIADPAKQEVVISIDGIDQRVLDAYHEAEDDQPMSTAGRIARRVAKAAREQLGQVQA